MRSSRTLIALAALALAAGVAATSLSGCDLIQSASNEKMLAATVMATPPYDFCNVLLQQLPDGGLPIEIDGGLPTTSDGGSPCQVPSKMVAEVMFANRNGGSQNGISGATVTLSMGADTRVDLPAKAGDQGGMYGSIADLSYVPGVEYKVTVDFEGASYTASVNAPAQERIAEFHDHPVPLVINPQTEMRFTRQNADTMVFANVAGFGLNGVDNSPTYTTLPKDPLGWLDIALNPDNFRLRAVDLPGTAFAEPNRYYLVAVTGVAIGSVSKNLFTASTFIIGVSDVGLVKTR